MKNQTQIQKEIHFFEKRLEEYKSQLDKLDQIDFAGTRGQELSQQKDEITGKIHALKWVLY